MGKDKGLPPCSSILRRLTEKRPGVENSPDFHFPRNEEHMLDLDESKTLEILRKQVCHLYDFAPVCYFYLDRGGGIRSVNRAGAELLGIDRFLLISRNLDIFLFDESRRVFQNFLRRVFSNDSKESCELLFRKEGDPPLYARIEAIVCDSGEECRAVVSEITGHGHTDEALRAAQGEAERYRAEMEALMDAVPAIVLIAHDVECRHISGSRFTREMTGLPVTANFSKTAPGSEQPTSFVLMKNGREIPARRLPVQMAARGREVRDYEYDRVFADGTIRTMFGNAVPLMDGDGRPRGAIGAFTDITELKLAEDALKKLNEELENLVTERTKELEFKNLILSTQNETYIDGILLVNEERKIISFNRRFLELWDIPPELAGAGDDEPLLELAASRVADKEGFLARIKELYDNREEKSRDEITLKDGRVFDRYSAPMLADNRRYFGKVWYFRDITERREAEWALRQETLERVQAVEALREKERMLIQQSRLAAMGEMIGNIAHQWRQPLNNLGLIIQQLPLFHDSGELTGKLLEETVLQAMDILMHMSKTIDDFRNYYRPGKEKTRFRIRETIDGTLSLIRDSFKNRRINIEVLVKDDPVIHGYRNEFAQVLLNILNNARDILTERGTEDPRVTIMVFSEGDRAVVTIADNAGGIPDEIKGKIFDPYFTTKGPQSGTGVGLFMSKTIIEKNMGGRLTGCNIAGGAEFRIEV